MLSQKYLKLSRFAHFIKSEDADHVAVLNALNLGVVVVTSEIADLLRYRIDQLIRKSPVLIEVLKKQRILVPYDFCELEDLKIAQEHLVHSDIGILYLILTDICNLGCRYCYFEGPIPVKYKFSMMDEETARRGVDLFARLLQRSMTRGMKKGQIIFYGGEPFLNWNVMRQTLDYIHDLIKARRLPPNTSVTINTNGTLITEKTAETLRRYPFISIVISVDGPKNIHDMCRIDHLGRGSFERVDKSIQLLRQKRLNIGLSCTLTNHNLDQAEKVFEWLYKRYGISSLGFNILIEAPYLAEINHKEYAEKVADKLISCFLVARELGIYEDRIMRKVSSFVNGQIYFYDCGGCGGQIVISSDGQIGVCQTYCGSKKYFTLLTDDFDPETHPYWQEWRKRSPIDMPQCVDCVALGNCGGGCAFTADIRTGSIWNVDEVFCIFSKKVTIFLVKELIKQMSLKESIEKRR